jgi:hypothetical protein
MRVVLVWQNCATKISLNLVFDLIAWCVRQRFVLVMCCLALALAPSGGNEGVIYLLVIVVFRWFKYGLEWPEYS